MGYDLRLCAVSDEQLAYLRAHAQYTRDFIEGRRPTLTKTEKVGSWFSKREVERRVEVDVGCVWPESAAACRTLYSGGALYFVLNGTAAKIDGVTNFPNVGGRYRGEMLGQAIELGEVGLGHSHAFREAQVAELQAALGALDVATAEHRARAYALEAEQDERELVDVALNDIQSLREFLIKASCANQGMIWFWA
ncbi:hypothetical protein [Acidovorax delafieldii]|uniref:hypothetical protein n=1 Tax=Acidovorax delafieldii TaxID=47920 RepID=UPI0006F764B5|nr:hypothetical protein ASC83_12915 [Acidovorax sp. Root402]